MVGANDFQLPIGVTSGKLLDEGFWEVGWGGGGQITGTNNGGTVSTGYVEEGQIKNLKVHDHHNGGSTPSQ